MKALRYFCLSGLIIAGAAFTGCDDDDEYFESDAQNKSIVVEKVFLEDAESKTPDRDITGTFVRVGQMIRLEGSGFYGMRKVYINGYETYFNRAYVADNSMLITVNAKTPVSDADPAERNKIRLVKDGAEFVFDNLVIRAASPSVKSMSCTMPVAGETVVVYGENLQEVSQVTLPGGVVVTEGIESDEDGEWFSFVMPQGVSESGNVEFVTANGLGKTPAYFNFTAGLILNFDGVGAHGFWGSSNKDEEGNIKPGVSMIYDTDLVDDPAGTGRGKCVPIVPQRLMDEGVSSGKPRATECWTAGNDDAADDWSRMLSAIPAETPTTELAIQFDVYCPEAWSGTGCIQVSFINNFNFAGIGSDDDGAGNAVAFYVPWIQDGKEVPFKTEGWQTVTIPLSSISADGVKPSQSGVFGGFYDKTFQDVIDLRNSSSYRNFGIGFVNTDFTFDGLEVVSTAFSGPGIYLDNWRVVPTKSVTISDYPEDDEE